MDELTKPNALPGGPLPLVLRRTLASLAGAVGVAVGRRDRRGAAAASPEVPSGGPDDWIELGDHRLALFVRSAADAAAVAAAIARIRQTRLPPSAIPLLGVPHMGPVGARACAEAGLAWVDTSGNAHVTAPGLVLHVQGRPNLAVRRGRPSHPFTPAASRVVRHLLLTHPRAVSQHDLVTETGLAKGFASDTLRRLAEPGWIQRDRDGLWTVGHPGALLDAWRAEHDFDAHRRTTGSIVAAHGTDLLRRVTSVGREHGLRFAFTGLASAWQRRGFVRFRLATLYVEPSVDETWLTAMGFHAEPSGGNLWIVTPRDPGVFVGGADVGGVPCVSSIQTWVDLKGHPERANEAADDLRIPIDAAWAGANP